MWQKSISISRVTEFLKGHLCFLPFTLYSINALLFTTSNLLFTLYHHLQFTIPIYHLGFTIYHFQSTFIYFQLFTTLNLHVLLFIFIYLFTIVNFINYYIPSWFYYIPLPFYFLLSLHTFYSRYYKLNYSKTNMKIINST